jgi:hypothetical protein
MVGERVCDMCSVLTLSTQFFVFRENAPDEFSTLQQRHWNDMWKW